jgi:hypothetical protein
MPEDDPHYNDIQSERWEEMQLNELYDQLTILQTRAMTATSLNNLPMLQQLQKGIDRCNNIIASKTAGDNHTVVV